MLRNFCRRATSWAKEDGFCPEINANISSTVTLWRVSEADVMAKPKENCGVVLKIFVRLNVNYYDKLTSNKCNLLTLIFFSIKRQNVVPQVQDD